MRGLAGQGRSVATRRRPDRSGLGLLVALLLAMAARPADAATTAERLADFPRGQVLLVTQADRCLLLSVWFALRPDLQSRGLMYVDELGTFQGMYFPYPRPVSLTMWMKNTVLPLDMLFVGADGRVTRIAAGTKPFSEDLIRSGGPVVGVLEVNAGFAAAWGVAEGDRLVVLEVPPAP